MGNITVPTDSTLNWSCPSCASANYLIDTSDPNSSIAVNGLDETSGTTAITAGKYPGVTVETEGQAWAFTITPGNSTQTPQTPPVVSNPTTPGQSAPASPSPPVPTQPAESDRQAVLNVVSQHWENIESHNFSAAYQDLGPSLATGETSWVNAQQTDGITGVSYQFSVAWVSGNHARVNINQLQIQDVHYGCSNWSGHYGMVRLGGSWLINIVALQRQAC